MSAIDRGDKSFLWNAWILFKNTENTNSSLQLIKQGASFKSHKFLNFMYRENVKCTPSIQEFYESVLYGIIKRNELGLYQGSFFFYKELQDCLHEFMKQMSFQSNNLIEVFQFVTN